MDLRTDSAMRILAALARANGGEIRVTREAADAFGPNEDLDVHEEDGEIVIRVQECPR